MKKRQSVHTQLRTERSSPNCASNIKQINELLFPPKIIRFSDGISGVINLSKTMSRRNLFSNIQFRFCRTIVLLLPGLLIFSYFFFIVGGKFLILEENIEKSGFKNLKLVSVSRGSMNACRNCCVHTSSVIRHFLLFEVKVKMFQKKYLQTSLLFTSVAGYEI